MAYQSLILGVLFSITIFALKSGVGISYVVTQQEKIGAQAGRFLLFALAYGLVFAVAALILPKIDPLRHLAAIQAFIQSGMLIHLLMAGLMMGWGVLLLKQKHALRSKSRGWLMLAIPCPVCVTVIFFCAGFLMTLFPDRPHTVVLMLYLAFVLINLATMGGIEFYRKKRPMLPESLLGGAMILIAVYFLLSVTLLPQFADVDKIYRLAMYKGKISTLKAVHLVPFSILALAAFVAGYGFKSKKIRSLK